LTDAAIRSATLRTKPYKMGDALGLYLLVQPAGGKLWRLKYRFAGSEKKLAIGVYPETSLSVARDARDKARKLIASGIDPSLEKQRAKLRAQVSAENTFASVAAEYVDKRTREGWARTLNAALRRLGYTSGEMTAHGFRSTAGTLLNESGKWSPDAIERAVAHADSDEVRGAYHRGTHWQERVAMAQWWSDHLDALRKGAETLLPARIRLSANSPRGTRPVM
jgi:hypothetical protein